MTSAGAGALPSVVGSLCDSCHFVDEKMPFLRDETRKRRLPHAGRRAHGPVRDPSPARAHDRA